MAATPEPTSSVARTMLPACHLAFALSLVVVATKSPAAEFVVVPNEFATTESPGSNGYPFGGIELNCDNAFRYQQVLDGDQVGPGRITSMAFRENSLTPSGSRSFSFTNLIVSLSTTSAAPGALSTTLADNTGADDTIVFAGDFTFNTSSSNAQPRPFDFNLPFQTPFEFDPSDGNLLFDVEFEGCEIDSPVSLDAIAASGITSRVFDHGDTGSGQTDSTGIITRLGFDDRPRGLGGNWTVVGHDGEGFMIDVTRAGQLVVIWFTYDQSGNQMWLIGIADEFDSNSASMTLQRLTGPVFGPGFDPGDRVDEDWGTLEITFDDCDTGTVTFDSTAGFGSGTYDIARIYQTEQGVCP